MVTERQASQCLTYFIDSKAEIAASSACLMICGISLRCQLAFQNHGAGLTVVLFLCVFSLNACSFSISQGWCVCGPRQLSAALTGDSFTQGWRKARSKIRQRWDLPSFGFQQQHLCRAPLVACGSELLSHTIVFWAFCEAPDYFGREITMEGYGSSRAGSPQSRAAFVWRRARGSPTAPRPKNALLASKFPFNSLRPLWEGVGYNIGERLHLLPFCVSLCCDCSFSRLSAIAVC